MTLSPFDDIHALIAGLPVEPAARFEPDPALGRLGEIAAFVSRWRTGAGRPQINRPIVALYAGTHAGADEQAGEGSAAALRERLERIAAGGAVVNALAQAQGAGLEAFDLAIDRPVRDMTEGPAMSERECAATLAFGMEALAKQPDLLILGDLGAGGETNAAAIALALYGGAAADWTLAHADRAARAADRMRGETDAGPPPPLEVLRQLGGRETAAIAGAILAAANQGVPVLLDGYGPAAAAAVLHAIDPRTLRHVLAGHVTPEPGHHRLLGKIGLNPLLDLGVTAGEGVGATAALALIKAACNLAGA